MQKETVSNIVIGARNEQQLIENLGAADWKLTDDQVRELDVLTTPDLIYPHWVGQR